MPLPNALRPHEQLIQLHEEVLLTHHSAGPHAQCVNVHALRTLTKKAKTASQDSSPLKGSLNDLCVQQQQEQTLSAPAHLHSLALVAYILLSLIANVTTDLRGREREELAGSGACSCNNKAPAPSPLVPALSLSGDALS